jgi:hypothetical protein
MLLHPMVFRLPAGNHGASAACETRFFSRGLLQPERGFVSSQVTVRYRNRIEEAADGGWF